MEGHGHRWNRFAPSTSIPHAVGVEVNVRHYCWSKAYDESVTMQRLSVRQRAHWPDALSRRRSRCTRSLSVVN